MKKIKRNRTVQKGPDYTKIAKIFNILKQSGDWMHISAIAKNTGINQVTVRYYLDNHMKRFVNDQKIAPSIKLRLVRLKDGVELEDIVNRIKILKNIHQKSEPIIAEAFTKE